MSSNEQNSSTARVLMQACGQTGRVTGLSMSTVSTMYLMKFLLTVGTATVELLPHLLASDSKINMMDHYKHQLDSSWSSVFKISGVLLSGIVVRKFGTVLSDEENITRMETFMYRTSKKTEN